MTNKVLKEILDYIKVILIAIIVATLINVLIFSFSPVRQRSMEPTLIEDDVLIIEKVSMVLTDFKRGDIVIFVKGDNINSSFFGKVERLYTDMYNKFFNKIDNQNRLVKRIIGLPGDKVDIRDSNIYINDELLVEDYVGSETTEKRIELPIIVPEQEVFVVGDNRLLSSDSRDFGTIKMKNIEGKVAFRIFPFNKIGFVK